MPQKKFSIITINYNNREGLRGTINDDEVLGGMAPLLQSN